MNKAEYT